MKKIILGFIVLVSLILVGHTKTKHFWFGKTLSTRQVCKKWGTLFEEEKFRSSGVDGLSKRTKILFSFKKSKKVNDRIGLMTTQKLI